VDGLVIIEGDVPPGEMVPVKITGAMEYDLTGTAVLTKTYEVLKAS
jgi:ribosomal protein S12 methylthiotransferase